MLVDGAGEVKNGGAGVVGQFAVGVVLQSRDEGVEKGPKA